jgi:Small, acid-soluble spore proteins, alpha/beta type
MANNRRNQLEVPGARDLMNKLKMEVAAELGIPNYDQLDKGDLPARIHGKIGGNITRKLIEYAQVHMANEATGGQALQEVINTQGPNEQDIATVQGYLQNNSTSAGNQIQQ